jgi:regulator of protease activity HflC (stomatin/prohibitin superfamily)
MLLEEHSNVPTEVGLNVELDVGMLYHVNPDKAHMIFTQLGEAYETTFVIPRLASNLRIITGRVQPEALYTATRIELQSKLTKMMIDELAPYGIDVENVLFKDLKLPAQLKKAIETKTAAQQDAERLEFVILAERQEAERKSIEAGGIRDFQNIVSQGISDQLLQWKGIEASEKMITSKNKKLIVMGNSKQSLPVLMSNLQV